MGSVGDAYDNALCESFFATLECELIDRRCFKSPADARPQLFQYIEAWYNRHRLHSSLGYLSPAVFEAKAKAAELAAINGNVAAAAVENALAFPTGPWTGPPAPPTGPATVPTDGYSPESH
jgi:hypothetical protein